MSTEKHLTRNASRMAVGTTLSRILRYIRDMLVAHAFGAGLAADAFYAAYRIPNLLRRLLGEGSLSASFIPVLSQYLHTKSKEETQDLINVVFTVLTVTLSILTILGIIFAPQIVGVIAYGFTDTPEKLQLTTDLTRLMFPFLLFICLAALATGILNTLNSFFVPAVAPAMLSVAEIAFILLLIPFLNVDAQIKGLAVSVIVGGLGQYAAQLPKIHTLGWKLQWKFKLDHPGLKKVGILMLPSMIGLSVDQINNFVNTVLASTLQQGSITALYYSNRVMQLPLAIFGLALSTAALPAMAKCAAQNDTDGVKFSFNYSTRLINFVLIPSAVGLMVIGMPIIQVLFERGHFTHHASELTNSALFYYSLGLPAYAIAKVVASAFYAYQETKTPVAVAMVSMVLNVILSIVLMRPLGVGGLALAAAVSSYVNAAALGVILRKRIGILGMRKIVNSTLRTSLASLLMGIVCWFTAFRLFAHAPAIGMTLSILAGVGSYMLFAVILNIEERKPLMEMARKTLDKFTRPAA